MLKRNSGFIIGCVLSAGASFFSADLIMSDQLLVKQPATEPNTESGSEKILEPEQTTDRTYETDPFTVTSSGNVVKGVETEKPKMTEADQEQTDAEGNPITPSEPDVDGNTEGTTNPDATGDGGNDGASDGGNDGYYDDGSNGGNDGYYDDGSNGGNDGYYDDGSNGGNDGYYDDGSNGGNDGYYDDSSNGGDNGYTGPAVEIQDPGNGDYTYTDDNTGGSSDGSSDNSGAWTPDDVIIKGISSRYIDESELYNYNAGQLRLIRNEIFALHGRIFRSQDLADYFSKKSWYVPTYDPDDFDANMFYYLNDYEEANLKVILNYEAALGGY